MKAVYKTAYYLLKHVTVCEDMLMQITSHKALSVSQVLIAINSYKTNQTRIGGKIRKQHSSPVLCRGTGTGLINPGELMVFDRGGRPDFLPRTDCC